MEHAMSMMSNLYSKLLRIFAIGLVFGALVAPGLSNAGSQPRDADTNSIMYNGAYTKSEWLSKVKNGDTKNTAANLQQIYYSEGRGITEANFNSASTVEGTVYKDGRVVVGGKTVATGAQSIGRDFMEGSHQSGSVWERPTSVSFAADSIPAFVNMEGGTFRYAIIKSCGNPARATPVKPSPSPSVSPSPSPSPKPSPSPSPTPEQEFECLEIETNQPDKINQPGLFRFSVRSRAHNVTVSGYRFTVTQKSDDGQSNVAVDVRDTSADESSVEFTLAAGTWEVQAQVKTSAGITAINEVCSATIIVKQATPAPSPTPSGSGEVLGATLPAAGPELALGAVAGLTAVGYAGRAYLRSRRSVLDALRGKTINKP
jgi:hypothetical protein